jgi:hypothetical protein
MTVSIFRLGEEEEKDNDIVTYETEDIIIPDEKALRIIKASSEFFIPENPPETSVFSALTHGLTFGIFGEKPDTFTEKALSFAGELASIALITELTGGLLTPLIRPATQLGKIATSVATDVATGGVVSILTPEKDPYLPLEFGAVGLAFKLPSLYRLIRGVKEIPIETKEIIEKAVTTAKPEIKTKAESLQEAINKFNQTTDEIRKIESEILKKYITDITPEDKVAVFKENKQYAERELSNIVQRLGNVLTTEERKAIEDIFSNSIFFEKDEAKKFFDIMTKSEVIKISDDIIRPVSKLNKELSESSEYLDYLESLYTLGVKVSKPEEIETAGKLLSEKSKQFIEELTKHPDRQKLTETAFKQLEEIADNLNEGITLGYYQSDTFKEFLDSITEFLSRGNIPVRYTKTLKILSDIEASEKTIKQKMYRSLRNLYSNYNKQFEEKIADIYKQLDNFKDISVSSLKDIRPQLGRLILKAFDDVDYSIIDETFSKQYDEILKKLPLAENKDELMQSLTAIKLQAITKALSDTNILQNVIQTSGNKQLERLVLMYRASFGDQLALNELQSIIKTEFSENMRDVAVASIIKNPFGKASSEDFGIKADDMIKIVTENNIAFWKDLNPVKRQILSPINYIKSLAESTTNIQYKQFLNEVSEWLLEFSRKKTELQRLHIEELNPRIDKLFQTLTSIESRYGRDMTEAGLKFIDTAGQIANKLIDEGQSYDAVETAILQLVRKQPDPVQQIYNEFRNIADWILDTVNKGIKSHNEFVKATGIGKEIPEIKRRPAWIPFIYEGNYILKVSSPEGKIFHYDIVKDKQQAINSLKDFFNKTPNANGIVTLEPRFFNWRDEADFMRPIFKDIDIVTGRNANEIKKMIIDGKLTPDTLTDVFFGSLLPRTLNLEGRRLPTLKALMINAHAGLRFSNYLTLTERGMHYYRLLKDNGLTQFADFIKTYVDDILGRSRNLENIFNTHMNTILESAFKIPFLRNLFSAFGITPESRVSRALTNMLTFFGRMYTIGLNPATALINQTLYLVNVTPVVGWKNAIYGIRYLPQAFRKGNEFYELIEKSGIRLTLGGIGMKEYLLQPDILTTRLSKAVDKIDEFMMWGFNKSEELTRGATLISAYNQGKQLAKELARGKSPVTWQEKLLRDIADIKGMKINSKEVLQEYARRVMEKTNFIYDITDMPELLRHPLTKPFMQFKAFMIKQLEFWFGSELSTKEKIFSLGMFLSLAGLMGTPLTMLDSISRTLFGFSPAWFIRNHAPEWIVYGLPALAGIDLSGRMNIGEFNFFFNMDNILGIAPARLMKAFYYYSLGQTDKAGELATPNFARILNDVVELLSTGEIRNPFSGNISVLKQEDITNPLQFFMRLSGIPTVAESDFRLQELSARAIAKKVSSTNSAVLRRITSAINRGDYKEASRLAEKYNIQQKQIKKAIRSIQKTKEEYIKDIIPNKVEEEFENLYE